MASKNDNNSGLLPSVDENASLYPYHVNLAQAEIPVPEAIDKKAAEQIPPETAEEVKQEKEEVKTEDPGVILLPDTADDVVKIQIAAELLLEDDGSKELYKIKHNNNGLVEDVPRDLGIPPVVYELPRTEITFISQAILPVADNCCHSDVELSVTAYTGSGSLIISEGDGEEGEESPGTTSIYFNSDPTATVFIGELIREIRYSDGSSATTEQRINDFNFSFTYTNCDEDGDGVLDSRLTFTFENIYTYSNVYTEGETTSGFTSNFFTSETVIIDAPQSDDCCSFELSIDEVNFAYAMSNATSGGFDALTAGDVLDYFTDNYYDNFEDCDNNLYTIEESEGGYRLVELDLRDTYPVVLDLTGEGINVTTIDQGVMYDMNHDGIKDASSWIGEGNGLLIYDVNQDQTVTNASEFILTDHAPGAKTDLEALRLGFDTNQDNLFDQNDSAWNLFGVWQDANKDAVVDNGEYHTLAQLGIVSIHLMANPGSESVMNGNTVYGISSFTRSDGSVGAVADVALRYQAVVHDSNDIIQSSQQSATTSQASDQAPIAVAQNDPTVQSAVDQLANQAATAAI